LVWTAVANLRRTWWKVERTGEEGEQQTEGDEMTREHAIEMREVFNAFCDGKEMQMASRMYKQCVLPVKDWSTCADLEFNPNYLYRIKPEPLEMWVVKHGNTVWGCHEVEGAAKLQQSRITGSTIHRMKEVE
jgi:hypothetical protein